MIALRLVRLIESHSEELAITLMRKMDNDNRCSDLRKVPLPELQERSREIYQHLSEWLIRTPAADVERAYRHIGRRRIEQGVRFSHFYWAVIGTKEHLYEFLLREGVTESPLDLHGGFELVRLIEQFFERAILYVALEYERAGALGNSVEYRAVHA